MSQQSPQYLQRKTAPHFQVQLESVMESADEVQKSELCRLTQSVEHALGFIGYSGSGEVLARYVLNDCLQRMASTVRTSEAMLTNKNQPLYAARHGVTLKTLDVKKRQLKILESLFEALQEIPPTLKSGESMNPSYYLYTPNHGFWHNISSSWIQSTSGATRVHADACCPSSACIVPVDSVQELLMNDFIDHYVGSVMSWDGAEVASLLENQLEATFANLGAGDWRVSEKLATDDRVREILYQWLNGLQTKDLLRTYNQDSDDIAYYGDDGTVFLLPSLDRLKAMAE
ncbi:hypothetical protein AB6D11_18750 [Vibrio splendidus]